VIGSRFLRNPNIISTYHFTGKYPGFIAFGKKAAELLCQYESKTLNNNISDFFSHNGLKVAEVPISVRKKKISQHSIKKTIIALPAYNEETNLGFVIKGALQFSNTILVVDDGSTDNTALVAEEAGAIVVKHEKNLGYGGALNTIFSTSRSMEADALVIIDSDGQHNPEDIQPLLEKLDQGADVVIGSRFLEIKNTIPLYRKIGMKVLDIFTKAAGVQKITDSQSGFRAYGKKAIGILKITGKGMSAGSEILIQISDNNLKVQEVPITVRYDIEDTSTHNPIFHGFSVLSNIFALINFRNPKIIFGLPAVMLIFLGFLVLLSMEILQGLEDIPRFYLYSLSISLLLTGFVIGCEGQIYHYYINKSKN
jgi:glycosyltransferase involved in cell wall biosynthesis